jgi:cytochrome c oxidase subunit 3
VSTRPALDVSRLPRYAFGMSSVQWWGTMGLVAIEGTMFAILIVTYFYLRTRATEWPPGAPDPYLTWGVVNTVLFLASELPNIWLKRVARKMDLRRVRIGMALMTTIGLAVLIVRVFEFPALRTGWSLNAYSSIIWTMLGLHTVHLLTDWADTLVLAILMFVGPVERKRFVDVSENADYWTFVVLAWLPIFAVIYLAPRFL